MNKPRKKPVPLARWVGLTSKVRLVLPKHMLPDLKKVLEDVNMLSSANLHTAAGAARAAAMNLASEIMSRPCWAQSQYFEQELRMTVPLSEALTLLAWLLGSKRTDDAAAPLRLLIDALYQLKN